jgi:hypothetical protein
LIRNNPCGIDNFYTYFDTSSLSPFYVSEKLFLDRYVFRFKEEETAHLLNLYRTMMKVGDEKISSIGDSCQKSRL